jgi:hypothetical protein
MGRPSWVKYVKLASGKEAQEKQKKMTFDVPAKRIRVKRIAK